ncbi:chromate transporter [Acinetobacter rongchengensis]|uniref:Chromate transporter n=1 Tax=Acinetobacter rongchengensis TaxID=2419601 RepID=A0A3A8FG06_9GAMM|nr:chromate transporter [Acinetobacter rongchengensis]RKG40091.1 chromate transporter [Acinetobacter rongchengensis]
MYVLLALILVFTQLSLLAFGGGNAILPEMQHQVVTVHQWMTAEQFSSMFAMAQAAPGPNMMIVPLVGWHVAGPLGLFVTSLAKFGPSSIITVYALKFWNNFKDHPFRAKFEKALKPITVGLVLVSAWIIAQASAQSMLLVAIVILTVGLSLFKNIHPVWLMIIGASAGVVLL